MHDFIGCIRTSYCYDVVSWLTHGLSDWKPRVHDIGQFIIV
jgi:hypothetical protein